MVRNTAREIAIHLSYELSFTDKSVEELLSDRLSAETFASLAGEDTIYQEAPNAKQAEYIRRLVKGVNEILYMPDVPNGAAINEAVEIAKKYETPETVKFINGILGSFVRQEIGE